MQNPHRTVRLPVGLDEKARAASPELAGFDTSRLIRVGLFMVAGHPLTEAIALSEGNKRGPAPRAERERESAGVAA